MALALVITPAAVVAASTPGGAATPVIVAHPRSVMVNSSTRLTGTGFPRSTTLVLQECSSTSWIVPQSPCDTANNVSVTTDSAGGFKTSFKVTLCPRGPQPGTPPPTSEKCYIGEPKPSGIDTIELVGAAKITVTYP